VISSAKSTTIKTFQALLTKRRKREELKATVVEGPKMIFDLLQDSSTFHLVEQILVSTEKWDDYYAQLCDVVSDHDDRQLPQLLPTSPQVLNSCSDVVTTQGIVAKVTIPELSPFSHKKPAIYLVADGLQDPGNLGTLIRSCRATRVAGLFMLPNTCDPWSPKTIRSAMGTTFQLPLVQVDSWSDCMQQLNQLGCTNVYAATMLDDTIRERQKQQQQQQPYYKIDFTSTPTAIVLGSEGSGLSEGIRQALVDGEISAVHVPMEPGIESLNAAVCGSVILFEYARQLLVK
jgi:TrmH family RNA methyltransferase